MELLVATSNKDKIREMRECLEGTGIEVFSLKDKGISIDIDENGTTFMENSRIKAKAVHDLTGAAVMADDSGFCVDALDGGPGVYSARFMGETTSYDIKNNYIIDKLRGLPEEKRGARYVCAIVCILEDGKELAVEETIEGKVTHEQLGTGGFGFDPIFFCNELGCTFGQASEEDKNRVSHRGKALVKIVEMLREELSI